MNPRMPLVGTLLVLMLMIPCAGNGQAVPAASDPDLHSFILAEGSYTRSLGNLSPTFPSAAGGSVGYGHYFPDHLVALVTLGYSGYRVSDGAGGDQKLAALQILAGPRYYFMTSGFMPFVFQNIGMNIVTEKITAADFASDRTSAQFAWQVGVGGAVVVAGPLALEAQAKYNSHFLYPEGSIEGVPDRGNMTGFEYGIGLAWMLGK